MPALGDTRRVTVLNCDVPAAVARWKQKGWKVTRRRSVKNVKIEAVELTLTYASPVKSTS